MAELTVFSSEVRTVVKIAIMAALNIDGTINNESTREPDSKSRVSHSPAKREVNSPRVDNDGRLLWACRKCYS